MSRRIAELLDANPSARAVLLEKHGLVTWGDTGEESYRGDDRVRHARRRARSTARPRGRFGLGGSRIAELADERGRRAARACAPRAPRRAARRRGRRRARGRPQPRGGRVRLVRARARGEPDRRAVPRSPDQHEAQAARRRLRSGDRRRRRARATSFRRGVDEYAGVVPRLLRAQPRRRDAAVPDRSGRAAGRARARRRHRHERRRRRRRRGSRATSITARSRCEDAADALGGFRSLSESEAFAIEYWPLERYKLAQAPPRGELSGRVALITGGASGIGRATARAARRARRARRRRRPERRRRAARSPTRSSHAYGVRRAIAVATST